MIVVILTGLVVAIGLAWAGAIQRADERKRNSLITITQLPRAIAIPTATRLNKSTREGHAS